MASPTAIPNPAASSHHQPSTPPPSSTNAFSRSPTGTNPNPLVSPIYTSAGRSAFSLPGPNSNSTSPTTTSWYSAGFASNNSQRVRSPTASFSHASSQAPPPSNTVTPQRDYFAESNYTGPMSAHYRKASFGSASQSSSISSNDLEPTTPKATEASVPIGRVPSLGTSFEQIKGHRASWQAHAGANWNGLNGMSGVPSTDNNSAASPPSNNGGMGGIFRKFSFGSAQAPVRMAPPPAPANVGAKNSPPAPPSAALAAPIPSSAPAQVAQPVMEPAAVETVVRGRQASVNGGKRRPSPMGERLLMGHFNAH